MPSRRARAHSSSASATSSASSSTAAASSSAAAARPAGLVSDAQNFYGLFGDLKERDEASRRAGAAAVRPSLERHAALGFVEVGRQWTYGDTVEVQLLQLDVP